MNPVKNTCMVSLLTLLLGLAINGYSQSFLTNGLVAYYPFNGNANDESGNGNDGTLNGAITFDDGVVGRSVHLDGGNAYIEVNTSLGNFGQSDFTISAWVRTLSGGGLIGKRPICGCAAMIDVRVGSSIGDPNRVSFELGGGSSPCPTPSANAPLHYADGNWHHILVLRQTNNQVIIADSVIRSQVVTATIADVQNSAPLQMGRSACTGADGTPSLVGDIDEVRIYNHALSVSEIQELYLYEAPAFVNIRKAVYVDSPNLKLGTNYQLQVSSDLSNWADFGSVFTATNTSWRTTNYWDVDNWNSLYFRLQVLP